MDSLSVSPDEGALVDASTDAPMSAFGPSSEEAKLARLARKAESARQARLRHKDHVYQLSEEVKALRAELARREHNQAVWQQQLRRELQEALPADRWQQLEGWLHPRVTEGSRPTTALKENIGYETHRKQPRRERYVATFGIDLRCSGEWTWEAAQKSQPRLDARSLSRHSCSLWHESLPAPCDAERGS